MSIKKYLVVVVAAALSIALASPVLAATENALSDPLLDEIVEPAVGPL
jgi:hypothetical protein